MSAEEVRDGVKLTNLDQLLFEGAEATKRDLVDYLDTMAGRMIPELRERPLSVIRVWRGQQPFIEYALAETSNTQGGKEPFLRV
jgi:bifunctional non-homologous end joining protein LigD